MNRKTPASLKKDYSLHKTHEYSPFKDTIFKVNRNNKKKGKKKQKIKKIKKKKQRS